MRRWRRSRRRACASASAAARFGESIEPAGEAALLLAAKRLADAGAIVEELTLPDPFNGLAAAHRNIIYGEGGVSFLPELLGAPAILAPDLTDRAQNKRGLTPAELLESYTLADRCRPMFDALFGPGLDVILTPSAPGEAPVGLHTTGNAIFNSNWTLLHVPASASPSAAARTTCRSASPWSARAYRTRSCSASPRAWRRPSMPSRWPTCTN